MRVIRNFVLLLGLIAAGFAIAGKPVAEKPGTGRHSITAMLAANPDFKTLGAALAAAGLSEDLNEAGAQTLFAPTNAAFAKLPAGTLENLMQPANRARLADILRYHLVPETVEAKQLLKLTLVPTVYGEPLRVSHTGRQVMVGNARVLKTDIKASNGMIHAIDTVLMPDGR